MQTVFGLTPQNSLYGTSLYPLFVIKFSQNILQIKGHIIITGFIITQFFGFVFAVVFREISFTELHIFHCS